jgi:hypothetical protein
MPVKRLREPDVNELAFQTVVKATGTPANGLRLPNPLPAKNPAAVALGRLGGSKGGTARAAKLSSKRRTAIARKAAKARWG